MDNKSDEPQALVAGSENPLDIAADFEGEAEDETARAERHDGWTGQRMAMFCALLAETGIVTDACIAVGMSTTSAYSARRRNPLFAAAWDEALGLARNRLADALLERSLTGCVEKYYRDGELVGEKRILDNRLGMAILRRLDRLSAGEVPGAPRTAKYRVPQPQPAEEAPDWDLMLSALRTGDEDMMAEALVEAGKAEGHKVGEVGDPPNRPPSGVNFDADEPPERCWWDDDEECWMTDFPPPAGFTGLQEGRWGDEDYRRACTEQETEILKVAYAAELAEERAEDEAEREAFFQALLPDPPKKTKKTKK